MRQQRQLDRWQEGWGGSSSKEQESRVMDGEERGSTRGEGARCASREGEEAEETMAGRPVRREQRTYSLFSIKALNPLGSIFSSVVHCRLTMESGFLNLVLFDVVISAQLKKQKW